MEQTNQHVITLELLECPAFCVKDGLIRQVNSLAHRRMIQPGTPISDLLGINMAEYSEFNGGCLYLTIFLSGMACGASVLRTEDGDVFLLDSSSDELQALALAAQELRLPLTSLLAVSNSVFTGKDAGSEEGRFFRCLNQLMRIVSNMSDASRYAGQTTLHMEMRDIPALLNGAFEKAAALLEPSEHPLRFTGLHETFEAMCDEEMLERAVNNLVDNAAIFSPAGTPVEASIRRNGNRLCITVTNQFYGDDALLQGDFFTRFQRGPGIEDSRLGIGLGMVLVRAAAMAHGGTVLVRHTADRRVRITMTLNPDTVDNGVRNPCTRVDYAGDWDHTLLELSRHLSPELYRQGYR